MKWHVTNCSQYNECEVFALGCFYKGVYYKVLGHASRLNRTIEFKYTGSHQSELFEKARDIVVTGSRLVGILVSNPLCLYDDQCDKYLLYYTIVTFLARN